jgi:uncharacterized protein involved in exopolysaccharide biosynthesis
MKIQLTPRNIAFILSKRRREFMYFFAAILVLTTVYLLVFPWNYESSAQVVVNFNPQSLVDATLQSSSSSSSSSETGSDLAKYVDNSMADTLTSSEVAAATLKKLGVKYVYPSLAAHPPWYFGTVLDAAAYKLSQKDLDVKLDKDSNTLLIGLYNENPEIAQKTLATLIGFFTDKVAETERNPQSDFLNQQLDAAKSKVDTTEQRYLDYKQKVGISDLSNERQLLLSQRDTVEKDINDAEAKAASDQAAVDQLTASMKTTAATLPVSDENDKVMKQLDSARDRLADAEQKYLQAKQTYKADNPLLKDSQDTLDLARDDYKSVQNDSGSRVRTGINEVYQALDTQLKQTLADLAAETALLTSYRATRVANQARLDHMDQAESEMSKLDSEVDVAKDDFKGYVERTEEARISAALNSARITTVSVTQAPDLPYEPKPKIVLILAIAVGVALAGGIGIAFACEMADQTFGAPEQVEPQIGLPVLITLNHAGSGSPRGGRAAA